MMNRGLKHYQAVSVFLGENSQGRFVAVDDHGLVAQDWFDDSCRGYGLWYAAVFQPLYDDH